MFYIFDWDGTLCDSARKIVLCMREAAIELGLSAKTDSEIKNIIGLAMKEAVETLYPGISDTQALAFTNAYVSIYQDHDQTPCSLFPGVMDTLEILLSRGYRLGVATGKARRGLDRVLAALDMKTLFHFSRCADETASKPAPLMLNTLLAEAGVPASNAVMVGDTEWDMRMADNAGVRKIAVDYGAHETDRLRACKPDMLVSDFRAITGWRF